MLTSSTQLQNWSFHVVERTRTPLKCQKMSNAHAKRAKILFTIVKYANLWGFCCRRRRGCLSSLMIFDNDIFSPKFSISSSTGLENDMKHRNRVLGGNGLEPMPRDASPLWSNQIVAFLVEISILRNYVEIIHIKWNTRSLKRKPLHADGVLTLNDSEHLWLIRVWRAVGFQMSSAAMSKEVCCTLRLDWICEQFPTNALQSETWKNRKSLWNTTMYTAIEGVS